MHAQETSGFGKRRSKRVDRDGACVGSERGRAPLLNSVEHARLECKVLGNRLDDQVGGFGQAVDIADGMDASSSQRCILGSDFVAFDCASKCAIYGSPQNGDLRGRWFNNGDLATGYGKHVGDADTHRASANDANSLWAGVQPWRCHTKILRSPAITIVDELGFVNNSVDMGHFVQTEHRGKTLVITIDRAEVRNAITHAVSLEMADALDMLDADSGLAVGIITGAGGTFCAGMDLKTFAETGQRPEVEGRGFAAITEAQPVKPVIAAVEGYALAGGFEMALACDMIVAGDTAQFGLPEVTRGLVAGAGGVLRLPERLPRQIAMELALTGRRMSAEEGHRWGLVNRLVAEGSALDEAVKLADEIAANGPLGVQATKRIIAESPTWPAAERFDIQRPIVDQVLASNDAHEGATAFAERREPRWTGT